MEKGCESVGWVYSLGSRLEYWVYVRDTIRPVLPSFSAQKYLYGRFFLICRNARFFRYLFLKSYAYFNGTKNEKEFILLFIEAYNCDTILSLSE